MGGTKQINKNMKTHHTQMERPKSIWETDVNDVKVARVSADKEFLLAVKKKELEVQREKNRLQSRLGFIDSNKEYTQVKAQPEDPDSTEFQKLKEKVQKKEQKIERARSKDKKKREQEKAAQERAVKNKENYAVNNSVEEIRATREQFVKDMAPLREQPVEDWRSIPAVLFKGDEFLPDPDTGKVNLEKILKHREVVLLKTSAMKNAIKNKEPLTPAEEAQLETLERFRGVLDKALDTWSKAAGTDIFDKKKERVRSSVQKDAQNGLALAMEEFKEACKNLTVDMAERCLDKIQRKSSYLKKHDALRDRCEKDTEQILGEKGVYTNQFIGYVQETNDLIMGSFLTKDGIEKEKEALLTNIHNELKHLCQMESERELVNASVLSLKDKSAKEMLEVRQRKEEKESQKVRKYIEHCRNAIKYLTTGEGPQDLDDALFLKVQWGLVTTEADKADVVKVEREEFDAEIKRKKQWYQDELAKAERELEKDPENEELQYKKKCLTNCVDAVTFPSAVQAENRMSDWSRKMTALDSKRQNEGLYTRTNHFVKIKSTTEDYRDLVRTIMPLGQYDESKEQDVADAMDNIHILKTGKHMDGDVASPDETANAMYTEIEIIKTACADLREHIEQNRPLYYDANLSMVERLKGYKTMEMIFKKAQSIRTRVKNILDNTVALELSEEERKELKDFRYFTNTIFDYTREFTSGLSIYQETGNNAEVLEKFFSGTYTFEEQYKRELSYS